MQMKKRKQIKMDKSANNLSLGSMDIELIYCENQEKGCLFKTTENDIKNKHHQVCSFRTASCKTCPWTGFIKDLEAHVESKSYLITDDGNYQIKLKPECEFGYLIESHETLFWLKCKIINSFIMWTLQSFNMDSTEKMYPFQVEVYNANLTTTDSKIILTAKPCTSYEENCFVDFGRYVIKKPIKSLAIFLGNKQTLHFRIKLLKSTNQPLHNNNPFDDKKYNKNEACNIKNFQFMSHRDRLSAYQLNRQLDMRKLSLNNAIESVNFNLDRERGYLERKLQDAKQKKKQPVEKSNIEKDFFELKSVHDEAKEYKLWDSR